MANPITDSDVACRYRPWSLAAACRFCSSGLCLDSYIYLARTAVCKLAHGFWRGSVGCHTSLELTPAAPSPFNRVPARSGCMRGRDLFVALVARGMASWSCFHSFRPDCVGSCDDLGNSNSQKANRFPSRKVDAGHDISLRINVVSVMRL